VEWCLNGGRSIAVEQKASRVTNITENARRFGVEARLSVRLGDSIALCADLPDPDAVFIGGGASAALIGAVVPRLKSGSRLVVNAVTLETEAVLIAEQAARGGRLMKIDVSETEPLGRMRGWTAARPVVQWSYIR
jgi:precorrin-6Y C5,15-methyltransferase (decarboxylating)